MLNGQCRFAYKPIWPAKTIVREAKKSLALLTNNKLVNWLRLMNETALRESSQQCSSTLFCCCLSDTGGLEMMMMAHADEGCKGGGWGFSLKHLTLQVFVWGSVNETKSLDEISVHLWECYAAFTASDRDESSDGRAVTVQFAFYCPF